MTASDDEQGNVATIFFPGSYVSLLAWPSTASAALSTIGVALNSHLLQPHVHFQLQVAGLFHMASYKSYSLAGCLLLATAFLLTAVPKANAGAVFEIVEPIPDNADDYRFNFDDVKFNGPQGSIRGSGKDGAGAVFNASAIPLAIINLNRCSAVPTHIHPNGAETLFIIAGKIRISQFRGEGDGMNVRVTEVSAGEAGYIEQGAIHLVENIAPGTTTILQIFDHPLAGVNFVANALLALPRNVVNSAFSKDVLPNYNDVKALAPLITVRGCNNY